MATYKTPGVFIEEIPRLGSSIAGVPTAVAGFTGYTQTAIIDGEQWDYPGYIAGTSPGEAAPPVRITSLLEFQEIFGGSFSEDYEITLTGNVETPTTIAVVPKSVIPANTLTKFILFYQVQMFYANGGGTCWIVSIGSYITPFPTTALLTTALNEGVKKFEQIDEVTILCAPEAVFLSTIGQRKTVYETMVAQCAKLQDRFALLDTVHNGNTTVVGNNTIFEDATDFRNNDIGPDNLKYTGAYYPALETPLIYTYKDSDIKVVDNRTIGLMPPNNYKYVAPYDSLPFVLSGNQAFRQYTVTGTGPFLTNGDDDFEIIIDITTSAVMTPTAVPDPGNPDEYDPGTGTREDSVNNLIAAINAHPVLSQYVVASFIDDSPLVFQITARVVGGLGKTYSTDCSAVSAFTPNGPNNLQNGIGADIDLYNRIKDELGKYTLNLYPSASMAGIYARVDAARGVWKAPANVGVALVNKPAITIDASEQENLNVDSVSGKSINAVRQFAGRGTLVWGARTLAGNDNEWRYINVRRLFTFVEESCKKATEFVVFESNTAVTWNRVKGMIEAFLTDLWRDGALAGATTKDAFFVQVGLGVTMTPNDILNGKMIVRIGMAAARPAEFIILQFEHKLQES